MKSLPNLKSHRWIVLICLSLLIGGATVPPALAQQVPPPNIINPVPIAELPSKIAQELLKRVAKDNRIAASKLKITEVKPATFSGCLGIYRPNQACTMIALPGWQAIVTSPQRTFVYHLTTDSRIVQNTTASGADSKIRVSFELFGGQVPALESKDIVFRSTLFGGIDGRMTTITLTEEGRVTESTTIPNNRPTSIVRKTITPQQVTRFKRLLENQRFPNFNGLSYLTSAALADYPTTTYQSQFTVTQFIDLEKRRLPRSYQQVINAWENLIRR